MEHLIRLSVRSLVNFVMRSGDIDNSFLRSIRAMEGSQIHRKLQDLYDDSYQREVYLKNETITGGMVFVVEGRADGISIIQEGAVIDEIKSTTRPLDQLDYESNPLHWAQAKCYGYFFGIANGLERITIQLTYFQVDEEETKQIRQQFDIGELWLFYEDLLLRYLEFSKRIATWQMERDRTIETLFFPFASYRKGQRELAVAVYNAIQNGETLLVEAPTGIGKTISTLFPAIKSIGQKLTDKIFYLTARSTQKEAANKAVYFLTDRGLRIKTITLTAKEKICLNDVLRCNPRDCPYAKGHFDRINDAILDVYDQEDLLLSTNIQHYAEKHCVCPFELQLDLALYADLVIGDYNYVYDPMINLRRFFDETLERYVFLVDESHNLVDRGRSMFTATLPRSRFEDLLPVIFEEKKLTRQMNKVIQLYDNWQAKKITAGAYCQKDPPEDWYPILKTLMGRLEKFLLKDKNHPVYDQLLDFYFLINRFLKIAEYYYDGYVTLYYLEGQDWILQLLCLDTSRIFERILQRAVSTIYFSATLSPLPFYRELLGGGENAYLYRLPSPFDAAHLHVSIAPVSTRLVHREKTIDQVVEQIQAFSEKSGNYMVFFPSYTYMNLVLEKFESKHQRLFVQSPAMTESDQEEFLKQFTTKSQIIAFVVLGGVFAEGIDLVGEKLIGAVIVSVGLPGISLERNLIRDYFQKKNGLGYEYAYLYPGLNKVLQAAGRVIRSSADRGAVLLIDDRFQRATYLSILPAHWSNLHSVRNAHQIKIRLKQFWQKAEQANRGGRLDKGDGLKT